MLIMNPYFLNSFRSFHISLIKPESSSITNIQICKRFWIISTSGQIFLFYPENEGFKEIPIGMVKFSRGDLIPWGGGGQGAHWQF